MKQGFPRNREMKPRGLVRMTDNISFQVPEIPAGLIEQGVAVPWRCPKIPEVRDYKEQDPKKKERCFGIHEDSGTPSQLPRAGCKSSKQKEHAEEPADRLPWVAPTGFMIMRGSADDAYQQADD